MTENYFTRSPITMGILGADMHKIQSDKTDSNVITKMISLPEQTEASFFKPKIKASTQEEFSLDKIENNHSTNLTLLIVIRQSQYFEINFKIEKLKSKDKNLH